MAPDSIVHIVRHAQGYHQLPLQAPATFLHDPELTAYGHEQAEEFSKAFLPSKTVDLLAASPLRRTLQTALLIIPISRRPSGLCLALPDAQETSALPSDTGSKKETLQREFGAEVDFSLLQSDWNQKVGRNAPDVEALMNRATDLRRWLYGRKEKEIVLVTHGMFGHFLTDEVNEDGTQKGQYWTNLRWRTFQFSQACDEKSRLRETEESQLRAMRNGVGNINSDSSI